MVREQRGEDADGDVAEASEVGVFLREAIAVRPDGAGEAAGDGDGDEQRDEDQDAATDAEQGKAGEGEGEIEHLLDGERPEDSPAGGEPAVHVVGFIPVEGEGKRGEEGAGERGVGLVDDVRLNVQQVEEAEDGEQEQEQRCDAGKANAIEDAGAHGGEGAEALDGGPRDEESGDGEEDGDAVAAVAEEQMTEPARERGVDGEIGEGEAEPGVEENDGQDGEAAEDVDGGVAGMSADG